MATEETQNESGLVCAARQGDKEALRLLLTRNWRWLRGLAYGIVADAEEVDDVLQDICVRVIEKIDTLRQPERFRPWLAILARRQALRYRQQKAQRQMPLNMELEELEDNNNSTQLIDNIEQKEQYQLILSAVKSLPEKYRQVFVLGHIDELTYQKIAEILDIPVTTVQIRLVRARQMIYKQVTGKDKNKVRE